MNKPQIIQQAQQVAREEIKNTYETAKVQVVSSSVQSPTVEQPTITQPEVNADEIKRKEQATMEELRKKLDEEIAKVRQARGQDIQQYNQKVDEQFKEHKPEETNQPVEMPKSVQKGARSPFGSQSKKGTKEMGKMKG